MVCSGGLESKPPEVRKRDRMEMETILNDSTVSRYFHGAQKVDHEG